MGKDSFKTVGWSDAGLLRLSKLSQPRKVSCPRRILGLAPEKREFTILSITTQPVAFIGDENADCAPAFL
jgi:hypothetical protein